MKVDFFSSSNVYPKREPVGVGRSNSSGRNNFTDVAEFSRGGAPVLDRSLVGAKVSIQNGVSSPTDAGRLQNLQQSVKDGSYHVNTDELVRAFLSLDA